MKLRLIELFAGYGSQAMALKRINVDFESWRVIEFDKYAIKSYNAVHGTSYEPMDITKVHTSDLGICDTDKYKYMLTYSFPCTDLSVAGKRAGMEKGSGTQSGLLWEVERILKEIVESGGELPQILFMENVPQVHSKKNADSFGEWTQFLNSIGYINFIQDLNARDYGIPQNRNRCFMFSFLNCDFTYQFPEPIPLGLTVRDLLEDEVDEKYYTKTERAEKLIAQLIERGQLSSWNRQYVCDGSINNPSVRHIANVIMAGDYGIANHYREKNVVVSMNNRVIDSEIDIAHTLDCTHGYFGTGFQRQNGVIEVNRLGNIYGFDGGNAMPLIIWQFRIRKLTPKECGRLMGVSDSDIDKMIAVNSNTQLYKQFGNSIVVDVMCAMFEQLGLDKKGEEA